MIIGLLKENMNNMKTKTLFSTTLLLGLMTGFFTGCQAKTKPVVATVPDEFEVLRTETLINEIKEENIIEVNPSTDNKDSIKNLEEYSLYIEYFKQNAYADAWPHWKYLFTNAPSFNKGIYVNGATMASDFIQKEKNPDRKNQLIDTLMLIYDQRIKFFGEEGFVLGKKGSDLFKFRPADYEKAYSYLLKSIELEGNKSAKTIPYYFMATTVYMLREKKITDQVMMDNFVKVTDIIQFNISNGSDGWDAVQNNVLDVVKDVLKCDMLVTNFANLYTKNKDNLEVLKRFQSIMDGRNCTNNSTYIMISEQVFKLEPLAKSAYSLGIYYLGENNYTKAISYFEQAYNLENENAQKAKYALAVAEGYKRNNNFPTARSWAQKASAAQPENPDPYMFIGHLYASSYLNCGNTPFEQKAALWAAVDQFNIARAKGSTEASEYISRYSAMFPTKEEAFYQDPPVKEGNTYYVGCWIGVSTTARFIK